MFTEHINVYVYFDSFTVVYMYIYTCLFRHACNIAATFAL